MDDQYAELGRFIADLDAFNEGLTQAMRELDAQHDAAAVLWRDSTRAEFDRRWETFRKPLDEYLSRQAAVYREFLETRRKALGRYLHGR